MTTEKECKKMDEKRYTLLRGMDYSVYTILEQEFKEFDPNVVAEISLPLY